MENVTHNTSAVTNQLCYMQNFDYVIYKRVFPIVAIIGIICNFVCLCVILLDKRWIKDKKLSSLEASSYIGIVCLIISDIIFLLTHALFQRLYGHRAYAQKSVNFVIIYGFIHHG